VSALDSVLVVQRRLPHYRLAFFEALRAEMPKWGCELVLAYGDPTPEEASKRDSADLDWAHRLPTRYWLDGSLCWQPFAHLMGSAKIVVLTPENRLLNNFATQLLQRKRQVVLWGHGGNLQGDPTAWREVFKRWMARHADWWLGYTDFSLPLILRSGFPEERITIVNNSVDTLELGAMRRRVTLDSAAEARDRFGVCGSNVAVFVGSLYADKRIDFLLKAGTAIRQRIPDFELIILGGGPLSEEVEAFAARHPWVRYLGIRRGQEKVEALALAKVMLNPGLVGLGILDSFVCEVPMLTTDCGIHSPEISYLQSGVNGWMTADAMPDFVEATVNLMTREDLLATMKQGCEESARVYTVDNMARRFASGIRQCLDAPAWR
jgi:glycosyltransferase involved in cell wall biosynthesis